MTSHRPTSSHVFSRRTCYGTLQIAYAATLTLPESFKITIACACQPVGVPLCGVGCEMETAPLAFELGVTTAPPPSSLLPDAQDAVDVEVTVPTSGVPPVLIDGTGGARVALRSLGTSWSLRAGVPGGAGRARVALGTLRAGVALGTLRSGLTGRPGRARIALETLSAGVALRSLRTSWSLRSGV